MEEKLGAVTIAPEVLIDIVRLTALATPGVARLAPNYPSSVRRLLSAKASQGIRVDIEDDAVSVDLYIVAQPDIQMLPLGQTLQRDVSRAIQNVVGMPVKVVNVHIEDIAVRAGVE